MRYLIALALLSTAIHGSFERRMLTGISNRIGSVVEPASADSVLGVLGDAHAVLGQSISSELLEIEQGVASISISACNLNGTYTAIAALQTSVNNGFNGTFTAIAAISAGSCDLSSVYTAVAGLQTLMVTDFNGTYTALASCCAANTTNFNGTFTAIQELKNTVVTDFNGTWTQIATGFNGTFTAVEALQTLVISDFNGTFTALASCCAANTAGFNGTYTAIAALQTLMVNDFNGTWTQIAAGFNGTFTAVATGFNGTFTTLRTITDALTTLTSATTCGITQLNVTPASTGQTINITAPGYYELCTTLTFQQTGGDAPKSIIRIFANDVTLDLNNQSIIVGAVNQALNGIEITGTSNITIQNGTIDGLSGTGVVANFSAVSGGGFDIKLQNVTVNKSYMGFYANTVTDLSLENVNAYKSTSTGAMIISTTSFTALNSQFNSNAQDGLGMTGVNIGLVQNCIARFNTVMGYSIDVNSAKTTIENNRALGNGFNGFNTNSSSSTLFGNLAFGNTTNYAGSGPVGYVVIGNGGQPSPDILIAQGLTNVSIV